MDHIFAQEARIYFVMQFVKGGELWKHLSELKRFPESRTAFYAA
jgi:serum/glucocorticoid-regulated kinase 2